MNQHISKNLVIVRAGDDSLHPGWIAGPEPRNWDCIVSYFGDERSRFRDPGVLRIDSKGPKWPALGGLLQDEWDSISRCDYVWLPDDDLSATTAAINCLFDCCQRFHLTLAQPSLSASSYVSHPITLHNPEYSVRFTNFVEIMAPCFTHEMLARVKHTFGENWSGWGLDYLWPQFCRPEERIAIVDAVQVRHTRPTGGPNYDHTKNLGISPMVEASRLLRKWSVKYGQPAMLGGIKAES
jgi:hypothetical protein